MLPPSPTGNKEDCPYCIDRETCFHKFYNKIADECKRQCKNPHPYGSPEHEQWYLGDNTGN